MVHVYRPMDFWGGSESDSELSTDDDSIRSGERDEVILSLITAN